MKNILTLSILMLAVCFMTSTTFAADEITMKGTYKSIKYGSGPLTGKFTETKSGEYDAVFEFVWKKKNFTYTGTVKGNLFKGKVSGIIFNETKKRRFLFEGKVSKGKIKGTQWETYGPKKKKPRGTFEMTK